jgi:hypothetical protein
MILKQVADLLDKLQLGDKERSVMLWHLAFAISGNVYNVAKSAAKEQVGKIKF